MKYKFIIYRSEGTHYIEIPEAACKDAISIMGSELMSLGIKTNWWYWISDEPIEDNNFKKLQFEYQDTEPDDEDDGVSGDYVYSSSFVKNHKRYTLDLRFCERGFEYVFSSPPPVLYYAQIPLNHPDYPGQFVYSPQKTNK